MLRTALLVVVVLVISAAWLFRFSTSRFYQNAETETKQILRPVKPYSNVVTDEMLVRLPAPVRKWMQASGVVGKKMVHKAYLQQRGQMCIKPGGKWMPAIAEQYFNLDEPAFVWTVKVRMAPGVWITGRDKFENGHGNMLIKLFGLFTFANGTGDKIDQGSMLRYLGELCWFPSAALQPYVTWQEVDSLSARATMNYKGKSVSAVFHFDAKGRLAELTAERYMGMGAEASLQPWSIPCTEWRSFDGVEVPVKGDATWHLPQGDYDYYKWEITQLVYDDVPEVRSALK